MLFEKLFVRDKRVIVVDVIDFFSAIPVFFEQIDLDTLAKRKLIYSMDQLTKCFWEMLSCGNRTSL